jgi:pyruvate dehydrogenase E1 component
MIDGVIVEQTKMCAAIAKRRRVLAPNSTNFAERDPRRNGRVMPEVLAAADELTAWEVAADVVCVTSADLLFRALRSRQGLAEGSDQILDDVFPAHRAAPIVTVLDGHPHTLSFLGGVRTQPIACLGVDDFG